MIREAGMPTPDWFAFSETAFRELGAADALGEIERSLGFPLVVKPSRGGSSLGVKFAADGGGGAARPWSPPSATTTGSCSSASSRGRELAVSVLGDEALPVVEAIPSRATATTSRPATRSAAPASSARPSSTRSSAPP